MNILPAISSTKCYLPTSTINILLQVMPRCCLKPDLDADSDVDSEDGVSQAYQNWPLEPDDEAEVYRIPPPPRLEIYHGPAGSIEGDFNPTSGELAAEEASGSDYEPEKPDKTGETNRLNIAKEAHVQYQISKTTGKPVLARPKRAAREKALEGMRNFPFKSPAEVRAEKRRMGVRGVSLQQGGVGAKKVGANPKTKGKAAGKKFPFVFGANCFAPGAGMPTIPGLNLNPQNLSAILTSAGVGAVGGGAAASSSAASSSSGKAAAQSKKKAGGSKRKVLVQQEEESEEESVAEDASEGGNESEDKDEEESEESSEEEEESVKNRPSAVRNPVGKKGTTANRKTAPAASQSTGETVVF